MANVFTLMGNVTLNSRDAERGLDSLEKKARNSEGSLGKLNKSFGALGKAALAGTAIAGAAIAGVAIVGIRAFADFDKQMREVFTLLPDITEKEMGKMRDDVKQFAKEFGVLPEETVPALYQAISAGVPKDNVFTFLETAQKAALGGVTSLETAVDGLTSATNAYGVENLSAERAADIMFAGVRLGKTTFDELSGSMGSVLPIASSMGVSFEDIIAGTATLTAQGMNTSEAMNRMRALMVEAGKESTTLGSTIRDVTGKSFTELIAEGHSVGDVMQLVRETMPDDEFRQLFGRVEALNAALGISGDNWEGYNSNLDEAADSAGSLDNAYGHMSEGMAFAMQRIKANIAVLKIEIGERLMPIVMRFTDYALDNLLPFFMDDLPRGIDRTVTKLRPFIDRLADVVRSVAAVAREIGERLMPHFRSFADWIRANDTRMKALGIIIGTVLVGALVAATVAAIGFGVAMVAPLAPALLVLAALGALAAGAYLLHSRFPGLTAALVTIGKVFADVGRIVTTTILRALQDFVRWADVHLMPFFSAVAAAIAAMAKIAADVIIELVAIFRRNWGYISSVVSGAMDGMLSAIRIGMDAIKRTIESVLQIITGILNVFTGVITGDWRRAWDGIKDILQGTLRLMWTMLDTALKLWWTTIRTVMDTILRIFGTSWDDVIGVFSSAARTIGTIVTNIKDAITAAFNATKQWLERNIFRFITDTVPGWFGSARDKVTGFANSIRDGVTGAFNSLKTILTRDLKNFITSTMPGWFKTGLNAIIGWFSDFINRPIRGFNAIVQKIIGAINWVIDLIPFVSKIPNTSGHYSPIPAIPSIPKLARGTRDFKGGLAVFGEQGPELGYLPRHTQMMPNRDFAKLQHIMATKPGVGQGEPENLWERMVATEGKNRRGLTGNLSGLTGAVHSGVDWLGDKGRQLMAMGADWAIKAAWAPVSALIGQIMPSGIMRDIARGAGQLLRDYITDWVKGRIEELEEMIGTWINPAAGRLSQRFGRTQFSDSLYGSGVGHRGIDIANVMGTPIFAATGGRITNAGMEASGFGIAIRQAAGDLQIIYGHLLNTIAKVGQMVTPGQQIGRMDNTGYSFGSHLHFEVRRNGTPIDPQQFVSYAGGKWDVERNLTANLHKGEMVAPARMAADLRDILSTGTAGEQNIVVQIGDETLADVIVRGNRIAERTGRARVRRV